MSKKNKSSRTLLTPLVIQSAAKDPGRKNPLYLRHLPSQGRTHCKHVAPLEGVWGSLCTKKDAASRRPYDVYAVWRSLIAATSHFSHSSFLTPLSLLLFTYFTALNKSSSIPIHCASVPLTRSSQMFWTSCDSNNNNHSFIISSDWALVMLILLNSTCNVDIRLSIDDCLDACTVGLS